MKIKFKIALLFTLLVTLIFLLLGIAIYYFSSLNRQNQFSQRLKNRALTNARLLIELKEMNKPLLKKIDSLTMNLLFEERIMMYDDRNNLVYVNRSEVTQRHHPIRSCSIRSVPIKSTGLKKRSMMALAQFTAKKQLTM